MGKEKSDQGVAGKCSSATINQHFVLLKFLVKKERKKIKRGRDFLSFQKTDLSLRFPPPSPLFSLGLTLSHPSLSLLKNLVIFSLCWREGRDPWAKRNPTMVWPENAICPPSVTTVFSSIFWFL